MNYTSVFIGGTELQKAISQLYIAFAIDMTDKHLIH